MGVKMVKVKKLTNTCGACPSQWEGITEDNRQIYIRYRWGNLTIQLGKIGDMDEFAAVGGEYILDIDYGGGMDGTMDEETLKEITDGIIQFR